jgi:hypothetical protein
MKKRSLFAAVAMLIVSAIVLTSATFAWFQTDGTITMATFSGTTLANNAGLLISANNSTWLTTLTVDDYVRSASDTNIFYGGVSLDGNNKYQISSTQLTPVSGAIGTNGVTFIGGSLSGTTFTGSGTAGSATDHSGGFLRYTTYVKSPNAAGNIVCTPTFTLDVCPFTYFAVYMIKNNSVVASYVATGVLPQNEQNVTYDALTNTTSGWTADAGDDYIVSTSEAGSGNYATTSTIPLFDATTAASTLTVPVTAGEVVKVVTYCWAEGQDPQCVPGAQATSGNNAYIELSLS